MTDKAFPRNKFDPERDFVVHRHMMLSGEALTPGDDFDKSIVDVRRLRQLYEQRYLRFKEGGDTPRETIYPHAVVPATPPRVARKQKEKSDVTT
jgi:hypothetical protein